MNSLASIMDMSAAEGFLDGSGAGGHAGAGLILGELDAFDDEVLGKMKKGKSHRYGGTTGLGTSHLKKAWEYSVDSWAQSSQRPAKTTTFNR